MTEFTKLASWTGKRLTSLLGLSLDGSRLDGVWLRRTNGSMQVQGSFSVSLSLDPLTAAPELVGREIRNHLDAAEPAPGSAPAGGGRDLRTAIV